MNKSFHFILLLSVCAVLSTGLDAVAEDWPQWQGPDRTNLSKETGLLQDWPADGPKQSWIFNDAGLGYSGIAVVGDTLYTMGARDDAEYLIAVNVNDGSQKWSVQIGTLLTNNWGDGPRSTPTVDGDLVFALGGNGTLTCVSAVDGSPKWKSEAKELGGNRPGWGYCESVLLDGDRVVWTPGGKNGAVVAALKLTGETVWQSKAFTDGAQYSSITIAELNGKKQYIQIVMNKLVGLDAADGSLLWESEWPGRTAVIPTPIFHDGQVFITSGYGAGCKLVKPAADGSAADVYVNKNMKNHHGGVLLYKDHIYGYSDGLGWTCLNFATGEIVWNEKQGLGKGCLTYADNRLYLVEERTGDIALIEASSEGFKEHGKFTLSPQTERRKPSGKIWTHPTVANGKLFLRDQELLHCYDIKSP
ncbi:MAG: outer membrane protein assembly factor BamB [Pirellulaceae bacterium]|jgi:outer membrane protein assembly factor BamB